MDWSDLLTDSCSQVLEVLEGALVGLSNEDLNWQPSPDTNSMGWVAWHLTRAFDGFISSLVGEEELWIRDKWYTKFDRPADRDDTGYCHGLEQVAAFCSPDVETQLGYYRAVLNRAKGYFTILSVADLDRKLDDPMAQFLPTLGSRLVVLLSELFQHVGQVSYIRGLHHGMGWQEH